VGWCGVVGAWCGVKDIPAACCGARWEDASPAKGGGATVGTAPGEMRGHGVSVVVPWLGGERSRCG
jgi:hypothetical protein